MFQKNKEDKRNLGKVWHRFHLKSKNTIIGIQIMTSLINLHVYTKHYKNYRKEKYKIKNTNFYILLFWNVLNKRA